MKEKDREELQKHSKYLKPYIDTNFKIFEYAIIKAHNQELKKARQQERAKVIEEIEDWVNKHQAHSFALGNKTYVFADELLSTIKRRKR